MPEIYSGEFECPGCCSVALENDQQICACPDTCRCSSKTLCTCPSDCGCDENGCVGKR